MSRSGYSDDYDADGKGGLWRGAVQRAIEGKRGQELLRDVAAALDAMPEKKLAAESLVTADGEFCTLGALGAVRGIDLTAIDAEDWHAVAKVFGVAPALVREIVFENDEAASYSWTDQYDHCNVTVEGPMQPWESHTRAFISEKPHIAERRWGHMRAWVAAQIKPTATEGAKQ